MPWKGNFQGLNESQRKTYFRVFRVLGKAFYEIQDFQGPLKLFQGFQGFQGSTRHPVSGDSEVLQV